MKFIQPPLAALLITLSIAGSAYSQQPIRFARSPDISPDGKLVAFSYLGDIWTVEAIGGIAKPVTMHEAHDYSPIFSPDGSKIAFSSNRYGSYDIFTVPILGGKPKRLTFDWQLTWLMVGHRMEIKYCLLPPGVLVIRSVLNFILFPRRAG